MRRILSLVVACLLQGIVATSLWAAAKTNFMLGVKAYEKGSYAEAARLFRTAIGESDQESRRRDVPIYGDRLEEYLPHYWLALSLVKTGQCREAQQALSRSEAQQALQQVPRYFRTVQKLRADCPVPLIAETTTQPPIVTSTAREVARPDLPVVTATIALPPPLTETTVASTTGPVLTTTSEPAEDPRLPALRTRLRQQIAVARQLRGTNLQNAPPEWSRAQAALQQSLRSAAVAENGTDPALLTRISADLAERSRLVTSLIPARQVPPSALPPAELRSAVTAFFSGDYRNAAETLRNARFTDARAVAQLYLIRGAARYSLYVADGEKDKPLERQALKDLTEFYRADPSGTLPLPDAFSPRLRKVLARIRTQ